MLRQPLGIFGAEFGENLSCLVRLPKPFERLCGDGHCHGTVNLVVHQNEALRRIAVCRFIVLRLQPDLCKNIPSKLDEDERGICARRLGKIIRSMREDKKNEYVTSLLLLAADKLSD